MFLPRPFPLPVVTVEDRFAALVWLARQAVAHALATQGLPAAVYALIDGYLQRVVRRFARLARMAREGRFEPPRRRPALPEGAARPTRKPRAALPIRMSGHAWIVRWAQPAALAGTRLHAMLDEPAFLALIGLDPRFRTVVRGLCAALATTPEPGSLLAPPPRPAPEPRPPRPRKPRMRKVTWKCAKPPHYGLEFSDPTLNLWYGR